MKGPITCFEEESAGEDIGAFPLYHCIVVASFEEGAVNQTAGAPFEEDDKDQSCVIIFKLQSLQIILVLQK